MKTLHFDCSAGISGDMTLGAFMDLGVDPEALRTELGKLGIEGWELRFERDQRGGISGTHAVVDLGDETPLVQDDAPSHTHDGAQPHTHGDAQSHTHDGTHHHTHNDAHSHTHDDTHTNVPHPTQEHTHGGGGQHSHGRTWKDIRAIIQGSALSEGAKKRALDIFTRIAEAEAQVHGRSVEEVSFHEVGALDSIIDIVGAAICLDLIKPDRVTCGEVELGGGTVRCAHGILPVPAPATVILTRGMPVKTGGFNKEMTTPTGAAILASMVDEFTDVRSFREIKTGYGIGTRKMERPNLLRISLREEDPGKNTITALQNAEAAPWKTEELTLMEANIDDMSGEALGFLMESLFAAGALDVTFTPCVMKKSRPGTIVSVLTGPEKLNPLRETLFRKSTTIGFRETPVRRLSLRREEDQLGPDLGNARRKTVFYGAEKLRSKVEFEDRAALARERNISLEEAERIIKDGFAGK
ncbi:conserved hypothetical protein [Treponema primitia ZAS-2]|uniref:Putative nickel insertion protein n=1 Tax=Treponema primitia (strain ATCC BAA-887 / DSM 12427 / ZAS-2) TaxID=545694 RepID=F5YKZ7_TREPZ|nr:nickel pincer cofactor biosynthesis protein LarC [Treponema primitia]AEF86449.1 conserved hypothetical protein [Treponema primitia ZAS-2]